MTFSARKQAAARAAIALVPDGIMLGVGTGSTVDFFIEALADSHLWLAGTVASSKRTAERLQARGFHVVDLADVPQGIEVSVYVDGADEVTDDRAMIKGGGGALTREKIVASAAATFVCIVDVSKLVPSLGGVPLPIEVIPMARNYVARELERRGATSKLREHFVTDNGNVILDVSGLSFAYPLELELELDAIAGVVANGLFARRRADVVLVANGEGVRRFP